MANISSELSFKFKYVKNNYAQGFFAQKALANEEAIALGDERLIYEDIADSTTRDNRLILAISPTASLSETVSQKLIDGRALVLEVYKIQAIELEKFIDRLSSKFYFYFLLIVYGFSYKRRYLCDRCANGLFWKTFLINFIFILGIIPSIWIKIKSMKGRDPDLKDLAKANALAKKGKAQEAMTIYHRLYDRYPNHPGLLMNQGLGHLFGNNLVEGVNCFHQSVSSCSNYYPVINLLHKIQTRSPEKQSLDS